MQSIEVEIQPVPELEADMGPVSILADAPAYEGAYEVTPKANASTVLETAGKVMAKDVTVHEVPVWRTPNAAGGNTVYIASERSMTHGKE